MDHTVVIPFKTFSGLVFADMYLQESHLMIVMFLETICAG